MGGVSTSVWSSAAAVAAAVLAALAPIGAAAQSTIAPDLERVISDPSLLEQAIDNDIYMRTRLGYRSDRAYVEDLYEHPGRSVGHRVYLVLLTPKELADLEVRQELEVDAATIERYYRDHPGKEDEFGGLYIDQAGGGLLAVNLSGGATKPWLDDLRHPQRIDVRSSMASLAALTSLRDRLVGDQADEVASDVTGAWIDVERGKVVVGLTASAVPRDGSVPDWIAERYGRKLIDVEAYDPRDEATATIVASHGYRLSASSGTAFCSFGFRTDLTPGKWSLTAGHCINNRLDPSRQGDRVYKNGNGVGYLRSFQFAHNELGDYGRIEVDDGDTVPGKVVHLGYRLAVVGQSSNCTVNALRYMTGDVGGTTWGEIKNCDYPSEYTDDNNSNYLVKVLDMVKYEVYVGSNQPSSWPQHGDSGGPVYVVHAATGTVTAYGVQGSRGRSNPLNPPNANTSWYGAYTKITQMASGYGDALTNGDTCTFTPPNCPVD